MGKGKEGSNLDLGQEVEGERGVVDGVFHVGLHRGYRGTTKPTFLAVDQILREQLEKLISEPDAFDTDSRAKYVDDAKATPKEYISKAMTGESVEKELKESKFWKQQGDSTITHSDFTVYESNPALLRLTNFWRSREGIMGKQVEGLSKTFVPKVNQLDQWVKALMNDADKHDNLSLNTREILEGLENTLKMSGVARGSNGEPTGGGRDRHGISEQSFLDIGIIRVPDFEAPYLKVSRLKLTVWSQASNGLITRSGIRGELRSCRFAPRDEHMSSISEELKWAWRTPRVFEAVNDVKETSSELESIEASLHGKQLIGSPQIEPSKEAKVLPTGLSGTPDSLDCSQDAPHAEADSNQPQNSAYASPLPPSVPLNPPRAEAELEESSDPRTTHVLEGARDFEVGSMTITNSTTTHTTQINNGHTTNITHITKTKNITNHYYLTLPQIEGLDVEKTVRLVKEAVSQSQL